MNDRQRELWERLLESPGVEEGESSWGEDKALWINAKQVGNFVADGVFELRLTRSVIRELKPELRALAHVHIRGSSDWVRIELAGDEDFELVVQLWARVVKAHLPADGSIPKPAPIGIEMARRKRFH